MATAPKIFISYCRKDRVWLERLQEQFAPLARDAQLNAWDDSMIKPGTIWRDEINKAIADADIAVLLVTPGFLASEFIAKNELSPLLAKKQVFWIAVSSSLYDTTVIDKYGCANDPKKPLDGLSKAARNKALVEICKKILAAVGDPSQTGGTSSGGLFQVPYKRNRYFTGRKGVLDSLAAELATGKPTALTQAIAGLGGVGKTQTAVEFAYLHRNDYRYVLWARADSETSLISEFLKLAEQLKLPEKDAREPARYIAAVQRWLCATEGYLLVLDNADEPELLGPFLPIDPKGHILITTRAHNLDLCDPIPLEVMEPGEALDFLLRRAKRKDPDPAERAAAEQLAREELGYLPLALEQAAAYIAVSEVSFQDYLKEYEKLRLKLLADKHHQPRDYPASVLATWSASFEAVRQRSAAAADVLTVSAFLASDGIPYEILLQGASKLGKTLAAALGSSDGSEKPLFDLLTELRRYSLIRRHPDTRTYDVHRLVQAVIRDRLKKPAQRLWAERAVRAVNKATPDIEFANWPACARLVPHWSACADEIARNRMVFPEAARLLNEAGVYLCERARNQEAEPLFRRALAIREQATVQDAPLTAESLNNLATLYRAQGRYAEAEPLNLRALAILESALGADHPDTAKSLNNLAELCREQGRYAEAEPLLRRAIAIYESALGADHPDTAMSLNNLALLYDNQGRYAEAEPLYRRALAMWESALWADHPHTARCLNNLATLYRAQGRYAEAEPLYRRALGIYEKALGVDHPDTAQVPEQPGDALPCPGSLGDWQVEIYPGLSFPAPVI